jgi:hypothetical protein
MLDAWLIEELKRLEQERLEQERPRLEIPEYPPEPEESSPAAPEDGDQNSLSFTW